VYVKIIVSKRWYVIWDTMYSARGASDVVVLWSCQLPTDSASTVSTSLSFQSMTVSEEWISDNRCLCCYASILVLCQYQHVTALTSCILMFCSGSAVCWYVSGPLRGCRQFCFSYGRPMEYGRPLYFHPVVCSSFFFFFISSPNLSCRRVDVCHTCAHGVALVRI